MADSDGRPEKPMMPLTELGFTELEATIYTYLIQHSPATGYRIAHDIGKPVANTYSAVDSLREKGAVMVDTSGENQLVRAVSSEELLSQLEQAFHERHRAARESLGALQPIEKDVGVYSLSNAEQVLARAERMLNEADEIALLDVFPRPLGRLQGEMEDAAQRGVRVMARVFERVELDGVETVLSPTSDAILNRWRGEWMNLVTDGSQFLIALLTDDLQGVRQAVWTESPFLSWVYHISLTWELLGVRLVRLIAEDAELEQCRELVTDIWELHEVEAPGFQAISGAVRSESPTPVADLFTD